MARSNRAARSRPTPKARSRRVESWIYEVINPLLDIVDVERALLDRGNVSFRCSDRGLEHIRPATVHLGRGGRHIQRDFCRAEPGLTPRLEAHDEAVASRS